MVECLKSTLLVLCAIGAAMAIAPNGIQTEFFSILDNMMTNTESLELIDGVSFVKTSEASPRSLKGDFGMLLLDRLNSFINNYSVRVDLAEPEVEGRGKRKKMKGGKGKNVLIPLMLAVKGKMMLMAAGVANLIAAIAGKAIIVSKIALILGIMLFLKKLVQDPPKEVHREHIKHRKIAVQAPEEPEVHHNNMEGWGKQGAMDDLSLSFNQNSYAHELAYAQQKPIY